MFKKTSKIKIVDCLKFVIELGPLKPSARTSFQTFTTRSRKKRRVYTFMDPLNFTCDVYSSSHCEQLYTGHQQAAGLHYSLVVRLFASNIRLPGYGQLTSHIDGTKTRNRQACCIYAHRRQQFRWREDVSWRGRGRDGERWGRAHWTGVVSITARQLTKLDHA